MFEFLVQKKLVEQPASHVRHKVKPGETLGMLARKYRVSVRAIQRANGLRTTKIRAKQVYLIPLKQAPRVLGSARPVVVPPRRRPPARSAAALPEARLAPRITP